MKIAALAFDTLGDQVLRQPMLSALLDAGHAVTLVVRPRYAELVPFVDPRLAVITCDAPAGGSLDGNAWAALAAALAALREAAPDIVVDLPYTRTAASEWLLRSCDFARRLAFFPGNRPQSLLDALPLPAGSAPPLEFAQAVTRAVEADEHEAEIDKNAILLEAIAPGARAGKLPRLVARDADRKAAARWIAGTALAGHRYIVLAPAGTQNVAIKQLPVARAVEAARHAWERHGLGTLLAGIPDERAHIDAVVSGAGGTAGPVVPWIGEPGSIGVLLALLEGAQAYVGADTGTMHFAAAVGKPVAALFGGGMFQRFRPAAQHWAAVAKRLACFGCEWNCMFGAPRCIEEVSGATWLAAVEAVLAGGSPGWMFDPAGLDDHGARVAQPVVAKLRRDLHLIEDDRAQRLALIERQDGELRALGERVATVEADREHRLQALMAADRLLADRQRQVEGMQRALAQAQARLATVALLEEEGAKRVALIERQDAELKSLQARVAEIEADRAARLAQNNSLQARVDEIEADRAARLAQIKTLQANVDEIEADRAARLALIAQQDAQIGALQARIEEIEADRAARLAVIQRQEALVDSLGERIERLDREARQVERSNAELAKQLDEGRRELAGVHARLEYALAAIARLRSFRGALGALRDRVLGRGSDDDPARH